MLFRSGHGKETGVTGEHGFREPFRVCCCTGDKKRVVGFLGISSPGSGMRGYYPRILIVRSCCPACPVAGGTINGSDHGASGFLRVGSSPVCSRISVSFLLKRTCCLYPSSMTGFNQIPESPGLTFSNPLTITSRSCKDSP